MPEPAADIVVDQQTEGVVLILYNTGTRAKAEFTPISDRVAIYVCGITPYDTTHLGHAFTYATTDILIRFLEYQGLQVKYVQNVTDIDDDILRRAKELGEDWRQLGNRWTVHYIEDMIALNVLPPDVFPRATDVIPDIIEEVKILENAGVAYRSGNSVYFDIQAWKTYGDLTKYAYPEMLALANERGNNPNDPNKRDPLDFVLWQGWVPGEPSWESPWGPGRPGWHIECSTMAGKYLGRTIDIHGGGADLSFPHHESEIAQMEAVSEERPFSRFWLHIAMVEYQGEKMSKSLGNLVMVRDLLEEVVSSNTIRLYLASSHYRESWAYSEAGLMEAADTVGLLSDAMSLTGEGKADLAIPELERFESALEDDLNTPLAIEALKSLARRILSASREECDLSEAQTSLDRMSRVLGLRLSEDAPDERVVDGWKQHMAHFVE